MFDEHDPSVSPSSSGSAPASGILSNKYSSIDCASMETSDSSLAAASRTSGTVISSCILGLKAPKRRRHDHNQAKDRSWSRLRLWANRRSGNDDEASDQRQERRHSRSRHEIVTSVLADAVKPARTRPS